MRILDELLQVRQLIEDSPLKDAELILKIQEVGQTLHNELEEAFKGERFEDFKKLGISSLMSLSNLADLLFADGKANIQEALFVVTPIAHIIRQANLYIRTEHGLKFLEPMSLVMSKLLRQVMATPANDSTVMTRLSVLEECVSACSAYTSKSFRQILFIPEVVSFGEQTFALLCQAIEKEKVPVKSSLLSRLSKLFDDYILWYKYEPNFGTLIGHRLKTLITKIKSAKSEKRNSDFPEHCKHQLT